MTQYIDKSAVVAEIEKLRMDYGHIFNEYDAGFSEGRISAFDEVLSLFDTLEVKEVDLEKATRHYLLHEHTSPLNKIFHQIVFRAESQYNEDIEKAFKSGFEHGLKTQKGE